MALVNGSALRRAVVLAAWLAAGCQPVPLVTSPALPTLPSQADARVPALWQADAGADEVPLDNGDISVDAGPADDAVQDQEPADAQTDAADEADGPDDSGILDVGALLGPDLGAEIGEPIADVEDATAVAEDVMPVVIDVVAPAEDVVPAVVDVVQPAEDAVPVAVDAMEPAGDVVPVAVDVNEPTEDAVPVAVDVNEPAEDAVPVAVDVMEPAKDAVPVAVDVAKPAEDVVPVANDIVQVVDVLSVVDAVPVVDVLPTVDVVPVAKDTVADTPPVADVPADADVVAVAPDAPPPAPTQPPAQSAKCSDPCASYALPVKAGKLKSYAMAELSGLAASRITPGVLWSHNDTGDQARVFALNDQGALLAEVLALDVTPDDWEDIAVGPCQAGQCVFIGDIGDNSFSRLEYAVYRIVEPVVDPAKLGVKNQMTADKLTYVYPGGKHYNAETLLIHPSTGDLYVVTKWGPGTASSVFRLPQPYLAATTTTAVFVATLDPVTATSPMTGGSIHPCGNRLLLRTYTGLFLFSKPLGGTFEATFSQAALAVPVAEEVQGEAVGWRWDGLGYYSVSEAPWQPIWWQGCQP